MSLRGLGAWPSLVAYTCQFVVGALMRIRVEGLEHLPKDGPVIIAPNHLSNVDPPLVGGFMSPALDRRPRFLAKEALFVGPVGWFFRNQGVVPVKTGGSDMDAYRAAKSILSDGDPMLIFPEGTRSRTGTLGRPRPGVTMLAVREGVPIVPVGVSGTDRFLGTGQRMPRIGTRVSVRFGKPYQPVIEKGADRRTALAAADEELMRRIAALVDPRHRGDWEPWPDA